jgi:hypothetical protein
VKELKGSQEFKGGTPRTRVHGRDPEKYVVLPRGRAPSAHHEEQKAPMPYLLLN